ncbi:MAG: class I SAM-dependent methyltransferase [Flavobacterium sp.]
MELKEHWEHVFTTKKIEEVSWYQPKPETSLNFFTENNIPKIGSIIEVGGGDSFLMDFLIEMGYQNLHLLDISANALQRIQHRLGEKSKKVTFIESNIIDFQPNQTFDVWHDRACFHFLKEEKHIHAYVATASKLITSNGHLFIGTFSKQGPLKCSGLEISQYDAADLIALFEKDFTPLKCFQSNHPTPSGNIQNFTFCHFQKK